jgi:hypothetical protein
MALEATDHVPRQSILERLSCTKEEQIFYHEGREVHEVSD